jgi:hypothetical protein
MREIRQSGSEGGGVRASPYPYVRRRVYQVRGVQVPSRPKFSGL